MDDDLKGAAYFVECVAVVAHDPAGLRYVAELLRQLKQRQSAFRTFCNRSIGSILIGLVLCEKPNLREIPVSPLFYG